MVLREYLSMADWGKYYWTHVNQNDRQLNWNFLFQWESGCSKEKNIYKKEWGKGEVKMNQEKKVNDVVSSFKKLSKDEQKEVMKK